MAGGTWTSQNKVRPGAYINFISVPTTSATIGQRGTVAVALPMSWGPSGEIIRVTGDELLNGKAVSKIGVLATDYEASLPYRLALSGCYTALFYRLDVGGTKATATITETLDDGTPASIKVDALYAGTMGNNINIVTDIDATMHTADVFVLVNGIQREIIKLTLDDTNSIATDAFAGIVSQYVTFTVTTAGIFPVTAGTPLTTGTNGDTTTVDPSGFFAALRYENFQCLAIQSADTALSALVTTQVKNWMEQSGKYVQAVVYDYPAADYEGIISVNQGFVAGNDRVGTDLFPIWVASQTAGAQVNESLTARVVPGATSILNPIDSTDQDVIDALNRGQFILTYRQDGAVVIESDINSFTTVTIDKGYPFRKNRVIRTLYELATSIELIFERNYMGKTSNNALGRAAFRGECISLCDQLARLGAITNFNGATDVIVLPGERIDSIVVDITIQVVDSIEKLYCTIHVVENEATILTINQ